MVKNNDLVAKASGYVTRLFKEKVPEWAVYHNIDHTLNTVRAAEEIAEESNLSKADMETLLLAAWFHDA